LAPRWGGASSFCNACSARLAAGGCRHPAASRLRPNQLVYKNGLSAPASKIKKIKCRGMPSLSRTMLKETRAKGQIFPPPKICPFAQRKTASMHKIFKGRKSLEQNNSTTDYR